MSTSSRRARSSQTGERRPCHCLVNNAVLNLKSLTKGANKSFKFGKYTALYLGTFNYRFNHRFDLTVSRI
jgi:hypothetical protein